MQNRDHRPSIFDPQCARYVLTASLLKADSYSLFPLYIDAPAVSGGDQAAVDRDGTQARVLYRVRDIDAPAICRAHRETAQGRRRRNRVVHNDLVPAAPAEIHQRSAHIEQASGSGHGDERAIDDVDLAAAQHTDQIAGDLHVAPGRQVDEGAVGHVDETLVHGDHRTGAGHFGFHEVDGVLLCGQGGLGSRCADQADDGRRRLKKSRVEL